MKAILYLIVSISISFIFSSATFASEKYHMNCSAIASYIAEKYDYEGEEDESEMWEDRSTSHWVALNNPSESAKQQYISYSLKLSRQYDAQADSDVFEVISELTSKWLYYCR